MKQVQRCTHVPFDFRQRRKLRALLVLLRLQQPAAEKLWTVALSTVNVKCPRCKAPVGTFCKRAEDRATDSHGRAVSQHTERFYAASPTCVWDVRSCKLYAASCWIDFQGKETTYPSS